MTFPSLNDEGHFQFALQPRDLLPPPLPIPPPGLIIIGRLALGVLGQFLDRIDSVEAESIDADGIGCIRVDFRPPA